jgi:hypothetical protein
MSPYMRDVNPKELEWGKIWRIVHEDDVTAYLSLQKLLRVMKDTVELMENANQEEFYKRIETAENQYWDGGLFRR